MSSSSSDPSLVNNLRGLSAIYMYVTESMIKFLPLSFLKQAFTRPHRVLLNFFTSFAQCTIQRVSGFYTCKALTRMQTVL